MNVHELILLTLQSSVIVTVFSFGLEAAIDDVLYVWRRPSHLLRALIAMFVVMPLVALGLSNLLDVSDPVRIALVALAISPIPPLLPKKQGKAGGSSSFALGLMVTMALLSRIEATGERRHSVYAPRAVAAATPAAPWMPFFP